MTIAVEEDSKEHKGYSSYLTLKSVGYLDKDLTLTFAFKTNKPFVTFANRVRLPILVWADSIIQVGSDSLLLYSVIYKFVITSMFNCHGTIA